MNLIDKWRGIQDDVLIEWNEAIVTNYGAAQRRCREKFYLIGQFLADLESQDKKQDV